ncbi:MAG: PDZ domain-containing protein [Chloroflexi bacterium]|nr:PDZ domain-containing protein [Chloroflexota bacterium]
MKRVLVIVLSVVALLALLGGIVAAKTDKTEWSAAGPELQAAQTPVLGMVVADLNTRLATRLGLEKDSGVVVVRVLAGSPAATAGLNVKDIITTVNGTAVAKVADFRAALKSTGDNVTLTVLRGKDTLTIAATARPAAEWLQTNPPAWLPEAGGIKAGERFDHYLGGQQFFLDKDGKKHTITTTPGIVKEPKDNSLTIVPNGQTDPVTFTVTDKTAVRVAGGKVASLTSGSKVVVITVDGSTEARVVAGGTGFGRTALGLGRGHGKAFGQRMLPHGLRGRFNKGASAPAIAPSGRPAPAPAMPGTTTI